MRVTQMSAVSGHNTQIVEVKRTAPAVSSTGILQKNAPVDNLKKLLSQFGTDDYIIIGIIAVLIWEGCDDYVLLAALGYLFLMGLKN